MHTHTTLGRFRCDICRAVSAPYAFATTCRSCQNELCATCAALTGPVTDDEGRSVAECLVCATPLLDAIRTASLPNQPAAVYRPWTRVAVQLTRQAYRNVIASEWREKMRQSAALGFAVNPSVQHDYDYRPNRDGRGGFFGD